MSSYPVFSGTPFVTNVHQLPFNSNQNGNNSSSLNAFQQNTIMPFLSFPPPSLPGSHHVFQNGPRFPGSVNTIPPASFSTNIGHSNMMSPPSFVANIPGSVALRPSAAFAANVSCTNNMISPASFATALTSMPPPSLSPWNPPSLINSSNFPGNFQQLPNNFQESRPQNLHPWATAPPNNFQNKPSLKPQPEEGVTPWNGNSPKSFNSFSSFKTEGDFKSSPSSRDFVQPWDKGSPKSTSNFNFQNRAFKDIQTSSTFNSSINPWSAAPSSSIFSSNSQYSTEHINKSPSKFRQSKSPACDINPWAEPPPNLVGTSTYGNNFHFSNDRGGNQRNLNSNKFSKFNHRRGNSRNFSSSNQNNNRKCQERSFQDKGNVKKELSESKAFSCDTCDRGFPSQIEFQDHVSEHTKCNFKGCQFEAHPKIVAIHKRMQHDTGYADAINKLKNADEIEKWRAERRRRFPTAANILKRKAEQAEKEARGEVIENKEFGKFKKQKTEEREPQNNRRKNRRHNNWNRFNKPSVTVSVSDSCSDSDDDSHINLRKFSGVLAVINTEPFETVTEETSSLIHDISEDLEKTENVPSESSKCENEVSDKQMEAEKMEKSIIEIENIVDCTEGSTSLNPINIDSDDETPIHVPIVKNQTSMNDIEESDGESPVEIPVSKVPLTEISNSANTFVENATPATFDVKKDNGEAKLGKRFSKSETHDRNSNNRRNGPQCDNPVRKSSLLEKLLADDIRHERNIIMQCVRHIVKKKFFGIGSES